MKRISISFILLFVAFEASFSMVNAQVLTLDSCLAMARRNNVDLRTAKSDIEKAQAVKAQAFTKYFPQAQLSGLGYAAADPIVRIGIADVQSADMRELLEAIYESVAEESDIKQEMELMKHGASVSVMAAQPIFAGGRIVAGNRLAGLGVEAAELQAQVKMRDVMENIESSYYLVTGLQQKVATVTSALALVDSLDRTVQSALRNGLVTRADALQVQLKRNEILAQQQQLTSGIRLAKRMLCQQIGMAYSDNLVFSDSDDVLQPPLAYALGSKVDSLRPEVRLLQLGVQAEELQRRMTLGEALPQVLLVGAAYYGNLIRNSASGNVVGALSISVPLTAWWEMSHKLRQHDLLIQQARDRQEHFGEMMSLEEEKAYSDMVDAYLLMRSDSAALDLARENYRLAELNYSAGNNLLSEVLHAQTLLLQAQNAITDRRTAYIVARRRLLDLRNGQ